MLTLEPDIVISYSGINDIFDNLYPFVHFYSRIIFDKFSKSNLPNVFGVRPERQYSCGIETRISKAHTWIRNQRMMKAICDEFGIEFYSFLQPMLLSKKEKMSDKERELVINNVSNGYKNIPQFLCDVKEIVKSEEITFINDVSDLFDDYGNVYIDTAHVIEEGNYIIANKIYEILKENSKVLSEEYDLPEYVYVF